MLLFFALFTNNPEGMQFVGLVSIGFWVTPAAGFLAMHPDASRLYVIRVRPVILLLFVYVLKTTCYGQSTKGRNFPLPFS